MFKRIIKELFRNSVQEKKDEFALKISKSMLKSKVVGISNQSNLILMTLENGNSYLLEPFAIKKANEKTWIHDSRWI